MKYGHPETDPGQPARDPLIIERITVLNGANYFSAGPVMVLRLNLGEYDERFTNTIEGFYEKLEKTIPSLYEHHCSEGRPGGFFTRVKDGTLLGHVAEHITIELQTLAGMDVRFGKTRATKTQGVYNVVYRFFDEEAGRYAGKSAIKLLNQMLLSQPCDTESMVNQLIQIREDRMPGPNTQAILEEARYHEIPVIRLDPYNLIQLGTGKYQKRIRATLSPGTSFVALENSKDSFLATLMLRDAGIPVPITFKTSSIEECLDFYKNLGRPIVVKSPVNDKTRPVFPALNDPSSITRAFNACTEYDHEVLLQEQIPGTTFRLLVINNKFVAATRLEKAEVMGNGTDSIAILTEKLNESQKRKPGDKGALTAIDLDEECIATLQFYGYQPQTIPENGLRVILSNHSSPSAGAVTTDVTGVVHPINRFIAEQAARISGLDVAGVNMVCPDISRPITNEQGAVINVLAGPDFRMHLNPFNGKPRNVAREFIRLVFPEKSPARVPVFSITGSAGKSVCAYLINFMLEKQGYNTGLAHSDGIYSCGRKIVDGDMAGHHAARLVLKDPGIDCAILETSVESIMRDGLGYEYADFGIILNAHDQNLTESDLDGAEDISYTQNIVAEEVYKNGFSILNADDPEVMSLTHRAIASLALFTKSAENKYFTHHVESGGWGAALEDEAIVLWHNKEKTHVAKTAELPLIDQEKGKIFTESLLAAILAAATFGLTPRQIKNTLQNFKPALHTMHGRLNILHAGKSEILTDIPSGPLALENLKGIILKQNKNVNFFIDESGNIPEDFTENFIRIFNNLKKNVFTFQSSLLNGLRHRLNPKGAGDNLIVSLKEYYFKETTLEYASQSGSEDPAISGKGKLASKLEEHMTVSTLGSLEVLAHQLHRSGPDTINILLSWNMAETKGLLHSITDVPG